MVGMKFIFALFLWFLIFPGTSIATVPSELAGDLTLAGNGPERSLIEELAQAFEKAYPRVSVEVDWHPNAKPSTLVKAGKADIAFTVKEQEGFQSLPIAWDGVAVVTNFANPVNAVSTTHVQDMLRGKAKFWSDVCQEGPEQKIFLVGRRPTEGFREVFERKLGILGKTQDLGKVVSSDTEAINEVAGSLFAVSFISMTQALLAQEHGISIKLLFVDGIEPQRQTVRDGTYPFRLPIFLLSRNETDPHIDAFRSFVLSEEGQRIVARNEYSPIAPR